MVYLLKMVIFHGHVSLPEGNHASPASGSLQSDDGTMGSTVQHELHIFHALRI